MQALAYFKWTIFYTNIRQVCIYKRFPTNLSGQCSKHD